MRNWINLVENVNEIRVYRGAPTSNPPLHRKMFFSSDPDFAANYGDHIGVYALDTRRLVDSLDDDMIKQILPIYDPYDDVEINTLEEYMERSSDTWEMIEERADDIARMFDASGIIVYEGGCTNYMIYDISVVKYCGEYTRRA